jgi:hypothetical protein
MANAGDRKYHVAHSGRKFGPLSLAELSAKRLSHDMLVWCEGMPEWVAIAEIPELKPYVRHAAAARNVAPPASTGMPMLPPAGVGPAAATGPSVSTTPTWPPPPPAAFAPTGRLKFLAITTIVLASLGLLICPFNIWATLAGAVPGLGQLEDSLDLDPVIDFDGIRIPQAIILIVLLLASLSMLIGGIGLLKRQRWAAMILIASSVFCILAHLSSFILNVGVLSWPLLMQIGNNAAAQVRGVLIGGVIGAALAAIAGVGWHITSLLLVNSAAVRQHLK